MSTSFEHIPVLPNEVIKYLQPERGGKYIDCTLGGGGHSGMILESTDSIELLGLDQDENALAAATAKLSKYGERFTSKRMNFGDLSSLKETEWDGVDGILMDIGVSSHQIDEAERGFSYMNDGPLDMRMDNRQHETAADILNTADEAELTRIFREYGEERHAKRVAKRVIRGRETKPWERTVEFAELVKKVLGRSKTGKAPSPAKCFQALRIAVNRELDVLREGLEAAFELLAPGGRLVVISFHSLEDRMVKEFFKSKAKSCVCPPDFPVCICDVKAEVKVLSGKAVMATAEEAEVNSRSTCSRLRAAEKI
ncbi:MAG: 16S rRNA (cytosine(1402)-N(4))-methyltransferase RsmH [Lentisphaeraceae bacterium]|nr:16S rRNA (cytosine(1402)-N(4))-methyltransferase RsmH [Lentisphaeraceae bacterium]